MQILRTVYAEDLEDIAIGGAILGTGGIAARHAGSLTGLAW